MAIVENIEMFYGLAQGPTHLMALAFGSEGAPPIHEWRLPVAFLSFTSLI